MMREYKLDALDLNIIDLLSDDARLSNRKIATHLGVTEGTVRTRVKRLEDENYIRFTVMTNMVYRDRPQLAYIGIHTEQNKIRDIADSVARLASINAVIIVLGRFDVLAIGLFDSLSSVYKMASNQIPDIPGVRLVETVVVVDVVKYDHRIAKIIP